MEDNRKEVDPSGQELIEGEQNGQTVQTLADDQNVKPSADEIKKAKKREADKRCRDGKKQKLKDILRQLQNERAGHAKLKKKYAFLNGKLKQSQKDTAEPIIKAYMLLQQTVEEQNKIIKQQNTATEQQNNMIYMLMQQLIPGTTGFETGETGLSDVRHPTINLSRGTTESGGPVFEESLPRSHQVERAHWNTIEQPPLSYGGLTHGGDMSGSHGLYYTSPPRAAMASGSSPMQGPLAPGGQLPIEVTGFGTGGTGLPVHHPSIYQSGTTMGSGGLANENSPGLPQSHVSQGLTHNHNQGSTLNTQLPFEVTGFGIGGTGLPVHHPPIFQPGTTMGSGGLANENSPGLPQSHVSQGLTHLPWEMTPDNTFDTWEAGPPVHHPPVYLSPPSHLSQGWQRKIRN